MSVSSVNSSDRNYTSLINSSDKTSSTTNTFNAVFEDEEDSGVKVDDFLKLMVAQLTNQDYTNPVDDTQYISQLAQFSTMDVMSDLSKHSEQNYVMSLLGKKVTASEYTIGGGTNTETGTVSQVSFADDEYTLTVNGKSYSIDQISQVYAD